MSYCEKCGQKLNENDQFCEHCGFELKKATIENKKSKPRRRIWKIAFVLVLLALIGAGVWQFNHYFTIQKRSKVKSQIDTLNNKVNEYDRNNKNLQSDVDFYRKQYFDLKDNPTTEYVPYQAPSSSPTMSTCHWIGSYYYCNYF